jgi:hypothetical protein
MVIPGQADRRKTAEVALMMVTLILPMTNRIPAKLMLIRVNQTPAMVNLSSRLVLQPIMRLPNGLILSKDKDAIGRRCVIRTFVAAGWRTSVLGAGEEMAKIPVGP